MTAPIIAIFVPTLSGGGVAKSQLRLAMGLHARGYDVDFLVCRAVGEYIDHLPEGVRLVELSKSSVIKGRFYAFIADVKGIIELSKPILFPLKSPSDLRYLPDLADYLSTRNPVALVSAKITANLMSVWAKRVSKSCAQIVITERTNFTFSTRALTRQNRWRDRYQPDVVKRTYPQADAIVAVSQGVAKDLSVRLQIPVERIKAIYNPVVGEDVFRKAEETVVHPWFGQCSVPVILGAGRLHPQKDFETLIRAFAILRRKRLAKLIILGEGDERAALAKLCVDLGVDEHVDLMGWTPNPYAFMRRSKLFVLSSRYEGLPGVLIQAMACGCPVVSTRCPNGPDEILQDEVFGPLVPIGEPEQMAAAMQRVLDQPLEKQLLVNRGAAFSLTTSVDQYLELLGLPRVWH